MNQISITRIMNLFVSLSLRSNRLSKFRGHDITCLEIEASVSAMINRLFSEKGKETPLHIVDKLAQTALLCQGKASREKLRKP